MKKSVLAFVVAGCFVAGAAFAEGLGGSIGVTSDNTFRGASVNDEDWAMLGDINYSIGSLIVGGTVANFATAGSDVELTAYANYRINANKVGSFDVGVIHYNYPGAGAANTNEVNVAANLTLGKVGAQIKTSYTNDYFGSGNDNWYSEVNGSLGLPYGLTTTAHYGYTSVDESNDYKIGLGKTFGKNVSAEIAWVKSDTALVPAALTDDRWVATAKYTF